MDPIIISSLISLSGVIISIIISYFISYKKTKTEEIKMNTQINHANSMELLQKRIDIYPEVYSCLSDFATLLEKELTIEDLEIFKDTLKYSAAKHGLLLSAHTGDALYELRKIVNKMLKTNEERIIPVNEKIILRRTIAKLEIGLKSDIYLFKEFESKLGKKSPESYGCIKRLIEET